MARADESYAARIFPPVPVRSGALATQATVPPAWRWPARPTRGEAPAPGVNEPARGWDPVEAWARWRLAQVPRPGPWNPLTEPTPDWVREQVVSGGPVGVSAPGGAVAGWVRGADFHPVTGMPRYLKAGPGPPQAKLPPGQVQSAPVLEGSISGEPGGWVNVGWLGGEETSTLPGRIAGTTAGGQMAKGPGLMETIKLRNEAIPYLQEYGVQGVTYSPLSSGAAMGPAGRNKLNEILIGNKSVETGYGPYAIPFREPEYYPKPAWYTGPPPEELLKAKQYREEGWRQKEPTGRAAPAGPAVTMAQIDAFRQAYGREPTIAQEVRDFVAQRQPSGAGVPPTGRATTADPGYERSMQALAAEETRLGRPLSQVEVDAIVRRVDPVQSIPRRLPEGGGYSEGSRRGAAEEAARTAARRESLNRAEAAAREPVRGAPRADDETTALIVTARQHWNEADWARRAAESSPALAAREREQAREAIRALQARASAGRAPRQDTITRDPRNRPPAHAAPSGIDDQAHFDRAMQSMQDLSRRMNRPLTQDEIYAAIRNTR